MPDLFTIENKIEIVEVKASDILMETFQFKAAKELIIKHEENYPDIKKWFTTKVLPAIKNEERALYVGFNNETPIATAVVKKGKDSKFCHLHINEEMRHQNIGDLFFMIMAAYVRRDSQNVHFSLPEGLWEEKKKFFNSFGFKKIEKYKTQYRNGEKELTSSVEFKTLWRNVISKLPDILNQFTPHPDSPLNGIVMSIHPNYSSQIMKGEKIIEIRRKFNSKWKNHKATIYSTSPVKELIGYATIKNVIEDKPEAIWAKHAGELGCTKSEFDGYTKDAEKIYAIFLSDINKYHNSLSLNYLSNFIDKPISPPQSYSTVKDTEWKNIISVAEILHGRFKMFSQLY